jgi:hypothetical protein
MGLPTVKASPASVNASPPSEESLGAWTAPFWEGGTDPFDPPSNERSGRYPAAVTAVALPDGRVLYWNGLEGWESLGTGKSRARLLDVRGPAWTIPTPERGAADDLWCSGQVLLHDGTVLMAGGTGQGPDPLRDGTEDTSLFDPEHDQFTAVKPMGVRRW